MLDAILFDSTGCERGPKLKVCQRLAGRGQDASQDRVAHHSSCPLQLDRKRTRAQGDCWPTLVVSAMQLMVG
jgi:hypothetical protein